MLDIKNLLSKELRKVADKIDAGTCEMSADEAMNIVNMLTHEPLSKEQSCTFLNVSRATFDNYVRDGFIPKGKQVGKFKELRWYKSDLDLFLMK